MANHEVVARLIYFKKSNGAKFNRGISDIILSGTPSIASPGEFTAFPVSNISGSIGNNTIIPVDLFKASSDDSIDAMVVYNSAAYTFKLAFTNNKAIISSRNNNPHAKLREFFQPVSVFCGTDIQEANLLIGGFEGKRSSANCPVGNNTIYINYYIGQTYPRLLEQSEHTLLTNFNSIDPTKVLVWAPDASYSCFSWSIGVTNSWINMPKTVSELEELYEGIATATARLWRGDYNYKEVNTTSSERDIQVYANWMSPQQTTKRITSPIFRSSISSNNAWTAKLGRNILISYVREDDGILNSTEYGVLTKAFGIDSNSFGEASEFYSEKYSATSISNPVKKQIKTLLASIPSTTKKQFNSLYKAWSNNLDSEISCNTHSYSKVAGFQELVALGEQVVPLLLNLLLDPSNFVALVPYEEILKDKPYYHIKDVLGEQARAIKTVQVWSEYHSGIREVQLAEAQNTNEPQCGGSFFDRCAAKKPSLYQYANFSLDVYNNTYSVFSPSDSGWQVLSSNDNNPAYGIPLNVTNNAYDYFGRAYMKKDSATNIKFIVIAHRGTERTNASNLFSDYDFLISDIPYSFCVTSTFIYAAIKAFECETNGVIDANCCVSFTGHSLGGGLAELSSLSTGLPAVTFESPGMKTIAQNNLGSAFCAQPASFSIDQPKIDCADKMVTGYNSGPNFVDTMGEHHGTVTRLSVPYFDSPTFVLKGSYDPLVWAVSPMQLGAWYIMNYSVSQHDSMLFNSSITQNLYSSTGGLRVNTTYSPWPTSDSTAACLGSKAFSVGEYMLGEFYEVCVSNNDCTLEEPKIFKDLGYNISVLGAVGGSLAAPYISQMFNCSIGLSDYYMSYAMNTFYWTTYLNNRNTGWMYDTDATAFVKNTLLHTCSSGGAGVTVTGDNSDNTIWTTTNCNDQVTTGTGNDIHYLFCGDDISIDGGGINEYHYQIGYMNGYPTPICGKKTITERDGAFINQSKIFIDSVVIASPEGYPQAQNTTQVYGAPLNIVHSLCDECPADSTYLFHEAGTGSLFANNKGGIFTIFTDCDNQQQHAISIHGFAYGNFGINQPSNGTLVILGRGNSLILTGENNIVGAVGCGVAPGSTINVNMNFGTTVKVFGRPDANMVFNIQEYNEDPGTITIAGVKYGDSITIPDSAEWCDIFGHANIFQDGITANVTIDSTLISMYKASYSGSIVASWDPIHPCTIIFSYTSEIDIDQNESRPTVSPTTVDSAGARASNNIISIEGDIDSRLVEHKDVSAAEPVENSWANMMSASAIGAVAFIGVIGVVASYGFASASNNDLTTDTSLV